MIRSKGFCWLATYHTAALYWSHAGSHFELKNVGSWWAAVKPEALPDGELPEHVVPDFEGEFGDRRQEIIFIGVGLKNDVVTEALDACLLSDDELAQYRKHWLKVKTGQQAVVDDGVAAANGAAAGGVVAAPE